MTTVPYGKMRAFDNQEQYASSTDTVNMIHSVIDWLSIPGNDNWLLIFDNFDDIDLLDIRKFIPRVPAGNVLITSRRKDVSSYWKAIEIRRMSREEGRSLLAKPSGIPEERLDGDLVLELLQLLSDFSLEIKQAGAYIAIQNSAPFAESQKSSNLLQNYIDEYHKSAATLLRYTQPSPIWDYRNDSVFTT